MNTDLKMRKCRGCDKLMIEAFEYDKKGWYHLSYCQECFKKYEGVYQPRSMLEYFDRVDEHFKNKGNIFDEDDE